MKKELPKVDIKGKDYVLVKDRVLAFNEEYPDGSIVTELVSPFDSDIVVVKAIITPNVSNPSRIFTGYSQAKIGDGYINKTSALENAETSAVGRALAMMGIGVIESIASADEIRKAQSQDKIIRNARQGKPSSLKDFEEGFVDSNTGEIVYDGKYREMNESKKAFNRGEAVYKRTIEAVQNESDSEKLSTIKENVKTNVVMTFEQKEQIIKIIDAKMK